MSFLKFLYGILLKVAHLIGRVNTFIFLSVFYFVLLGVAKLGTVLSGKDPLNRLTDQPSAWKKRTGFHVTKESLLNPY